MYLTLFPLRSPSTPPWHPEWMLAPAPPFHEQCYPLLHPEEVVVVFIPVRVAVKICNVVLKFVFVPTWELELKANLARAHALERSMSSRKKGKASLECRNRTIKCYSSYWQERLICRVFSYLSPVSSLSRKWMTTVLNTKLEKIVKSPAMPIWKQKNGFYCHSMELAGPKTHH